MVKFSAIIVCAGNSTRFGTDKQLELIGGIPVFIHSIRAFQDIAYELIVVISEQKKDIYSDIISKYGINCKLAYGSNTRQKSVFNGLRLVCSDSDFVAIHDGARPLIKKENIIEVVAYAVDCEAAALAVPVKDTIKKVENCHVIETLPREFLYAMQTPQVFSKSLYLEAMAKAGDRIFTDDCVLIENYGKSVNVVKGNYTNIKITTPEDLAVARVFYGL